MVDVDKRTLRVCEVCGLTGRGPKGRFPRALPEGRFKHDSCFAHGTEYGYSKHGCRCDACTLTKRSAWHEWAARNPEKAAAHNFRDRSSYNDKRRAEYRGSSAPVVCVGCGKEMDRAYSAAPVAAHKECRKTVPKWKLQGKSEPGWFTEFRKRIERNARGVKRRRRFINGRCPWCGESGTWLKSRFCSPTCRQQDRYARKGTFSVSPVKRQALYERDRSICHLCGRKVDLSLKWPDPMSPTLDHLVPQVQGGTHEDTNLRLAHFHCNSSRSDLSVTDGRKRVKSRLRGDPEPVFLW